MSIKTRAANVFEPVTFLWVSVAVFLKLVFSSQARKELGRVKTGMSKVKLFRYLSKKVTKEMPLVTPLLIVVPSLIFGIIFSSYEAGLKVAVISFLFLAVIPSLFPMPSSYFTE